MKIKSKCVTKSIRWIAEKEDGIILLPWLILYFFVSLCLFIMIFAQNIHVSTKYVVQDGLAAAALAGEVADLEMLSQYNELLITDLIYSRQMFEESIRASLNLNADGYPDSQSAYFDPSVPVQVIELKIYNVSREKVYVSDLLKATDNIVYDETNGLSLDPQSELLGDLMSDTREYLQHVVMVDGEEKEIKSTSLYAKIRFAVPGFYGRTIILEKDILTDIKGN